MPGKKEARWRANADRAGLFKIGNTVDAALAISVIAYGKAAVKAVNVRTVPLHAIRLISLGDYHAGKRSGRL